MFKDEFSKQCKALFEKHQLKLFHGEIKPTTAMVTYEHLVFVEPLAGSRYERTKQLLLADLVRICLPFVCSTEGVTLRVEYRGGELLCNAL